MEQLCKSRTNTNPIVVLEIRDKHKLKNIIVPLFSNLNILKSKKILMIGLFW